MHRLLQLRSSQSLIREGQLTFIGHFLYFDEQNARVVLQPFYRYSQRCCARFLLGQLPCHTHALFETEIGYYLPWRLVSAKVTLALHGDDVGDGKADVQNGRTHFLDYLLIHMLYILSLRSIYTAQSFAIFHPTYFMIPGIYLRALN